MDPLKSVQVHYTPEPTWPGALKTAAEVAESIGISEERVRELADCKFMPHWRIDGGEPLFQIKEVKQWAAQNLLNRCDGRDYPIRIRVMVEPPEAEDAPPAIREIPNLRQVPIHECPPGVYFLVKDGVVVYVGQSKRPLARIGQHHADKDFDRAYLVPVPSVHLDAVEGALIRALRPYLNGGAGRNIVAPGYPSHDQMALEKYATGLALESA